MANNYTLSQKGKQDILNITNRSMEDFGERQTRIYMAGLESFLQELANNPNLGRVYTHSKTAKEYLYRLYTSHVVYYRLRKNDIFILRVLHQRMLPAKHL